MLSAISGHSEMALARLGVTTEPELLESRCSSYALEIRASHERPPQPVSADVVMPRISGLALVERLRGLRAGLKVPFMSGLSDHRFADSSKPGDGAAFINQPFTPDALGKQLRAFLDGQDQGG